VAPNSPPVSTSVKVRFCQAAGAVNMSRVVPATGATIERRVLVIRLKRVDLPTFGRPTRTTVETEGFSDMEGDYLREAWQAGRLEAWKSFAQTSGAADFRLPGFQART